MLNDAVQMQGRQIKWKYVVMLILVALACAGAAWMYEHPSMIQDNITSFKKKIDPQENQWIAAPVQPDSAGASFGASLAVVSDGTVCVLDLQGAIRYRMETQWDAPVLTAGEDTAVVYEPGGRDCMVLTEQAGRSVTSPTKISTAIPGVDGGFAVITEGSGYMTMTRIYDASGTVQQEIALMDFAMAMGIFLSEELLVSACVSDRGAWSLRLDCRQEEVEIPLQAAVVYDLKPWGDGFALWTSDGVAFYDASGGMVGSAELSPETVLTWDCGDYAAFGVRRFGTYRILSVSSDGSVWESDALPRAPIDLEVCGNQMCVLDSEAMLIYDKVCSMQARIAAGSSAAQIEGTLDGCVLLGDGEILRLLCS